MKSKDSSMLFLICIALCISTIAGMQTRTWKNNFNHDSFLRDKSFLTTPGEVYGNCNAGLSIVRKKKMQLECEFAMQTTEAIDSQNPMKMCNFSITKDIADNSEMYHTNQLIAMTDKRAILQMDGTKSFLFFILNFDDCSVTYSHMREQPMNLWAPTRDTFDMVYHETKTPDDKIRTVLDYNGNVVSEGKVWINFHSHIIGVGHAPSNGRLVVDEYNKYTETSRTPTGRMYIVKDDGSTEMLKEYVIEEEDPTFLYDRVIASTTYNLTTGCFKSNMNLTCSQFDSDGKLKLETTVLLNEYTRLNSIRIRNLPRGGLLVFIAKCKRTVEKHCFFSDTAFDVKKIDATGKLVGSVTIDNKSTRSFSARTHIFENEHNEVCLSDVFDTTDTIEVLCLKDEDFSKEIMWPNH